MPTANDIISKALGEVGIAEYPPNSNNVKYNTAFYGREVSGANYPWCCAFVWWVFAQFKPCIIKKTASCQELGNWFNQQGRWHSNPQPGDVVFFHFNTNDRWTNHVGIVKDVKGGVVETIEGNTSISSDDNGGAVMIRQRTSNIVGYGRPDYSEDVPATDPNDPDVPGHKYQYGIDVSECQGAIDWQQVKAAGISFACLRSTKKNGSIDGTFEKNLTGCIDNGIDYSCYKYAYALSHDEARREADTVTNLLKGRNMPIWYDIEDNGLITLGKDGIEGVTLSFIGECKEAGFDVGIYCNKNWYDNYISQYLKDRFTFWVARYGKNNGQIDEQCKPIGRNIMAWQYTSKGIVAGISGHVDRDVIL